MNLIGNLGIVIICSILSILAFAHQSKATLNQAQITSVSQLADVYPTDWAFIALQSLVERYGCIAGYPNKLFQGNRSLSRYEFAAGLNACLSRINELVATATTNIVRREDLVTLQQLQALGGIAAGQPFIEGAIGNATQTNFEAFYNYPVNDNVRVTPLIQVVTNPANQESNGTIVSGSVRTVFSF